MNKGKDGIYNRYIKRLIDFVCAILAIIVFGWLYLAIAILVRVNLGSPILFKQPRPGKDGNIFFLYKFRTMTNERDQYGELLPDEKRLTKFGKWLRSTSLDELPEAWNILKGDMSVIGPRPQLVRDMVFMNNLQQERHSVRPGLSGLAQIRGRNALEWSNKLSIDLEYVRRISFCLDIRIVVETVYQVFFRRNSNNLNVVDEIEITADYGDFLLSKGLISYSDYVQGIELSKQIIEKWCTGSER